MIETITYADRVPETEAALAALSVESQAGLRQFSLERTMGYGIDYSDATELRARVLHGDGWHAAATSIAQRCRERAAAAADIPGSPTRIAYLRRASALIRMSLALNLSDTDEARETFALAARLYGEAAALAADCEPVTIDTGRASLKGWLHPAQGDALASVIVIGGIEGWAMDFDSQGRAFAARGIDALMLDGPGQGETRFAHRGYLKPDWPEAFRAAIDYLDRRAPGRPIGIVGHSMGGSIAMAIAAMDPRIRACCSNGGPFAPWMVPQGTTFFSKMIAFCDVATAEDAVTIWKTVNPCAAGPNSGYPLLIIHGGKDPLISTPIAQILYDQAPTANKRMIIFSDGDHCIYRHNQDRDILITDWMRAHLVGQD